MTPVLWTPGWCQWCLPALSHGLVIVLLGVTSWEPWSAPVLALCLISFACEARRLWRRRGRRRLFVPDGDDGGASSPRVIRRALWCLPSWVVVRIEGQPDAIDLFAGEMSEVDFAAVLRWARTDLRRDRRGWLSLRRAAGRPAGR